MPLIICCLNHRQKPDIRAFIKTVWFWFFRNSTCNNMASEVKHLDVIFVTLERVNGEKTHVLKSAHGCFFRSRKIFVKYIWFNDNEKFVPNFVNWNTVWAQWDAKLIRRYTGHSKAVKFENAVSKRLQFGQCLIVISMRTTGCYGNSNYFNFKWLKTCSRTKSLHMWLRFEMELTLSYIMQQKSAILRYLFYSDRNARYITISYVPRWYGT